MKSPVQGADKCVYVDVNAGSYGPMSLDKGPDKGQGPLDGDPAGWDRLMSINLLARWCDSGCIRATCLSAGGTFRICLFPAGPSPGHLLHCLLDLPSTTV
jgi:hypothetical protein